LISLLEFVAVLSAALFAGAALYINVVEHPARMGLETRVAALQWAPSYKRATWLQAPLAALSLLSGIGVWLLGAGVGWLIAAIGVGLVIPFTFVVTIDCWLPGGISRVKRPARCLCVGVRCMPSGRS
jgi:Domain of unknown function (DUF1772)